MNSVLVAPEATSTNQATRFRFFERLLGGLEQLPGIVAAGSVNMIPFGASDNPAAFWLDSTSLAPAERLSGYNRVITPGYFAALGVPLLEGRRFSWHDRRDSAKVVIVNDVFARRYFPSASPLRHRLTVEVNPPWTGEIVGVVGAFRQRSLAEDPRAEFFVPLAQTPVAVQTLLVRTEGDPALFAGVLRREIAAVDPEVPPYNLRTLEQVIDRTLAQPRLRGTLLGAFSLIALILASVGVYGVISCATAERRHEIGVRMAMGARPLDVVRLVVGQALALAGIGLALGLAGALALSSALRGFLFGVGSTDPLTFAGAAAVFLVVALAASWLPARRAVRVDPMVALREE